MAISLKKLQLYYMLFMVNRYIVDVYNNILMTLWVKSLNFNILYLKEKIKPEGIKKKL